MKCSQECIVLCREKLQSLGKVVAKTQFGGYSLSIDGVVFALAKDGDLFLRGSGEMSHYLITHSLPPFIFIKRGNSICLNYYKVDKSLWQDDANLFNLSQAALSEAKKCQYYRKCHRRLKDLPNLGIRFEALLREVGIHTEEQLRATGAKQSWLLIHQRNKHLGVRTLFYLQGAISGIHHAVLSTKIKCELVEWHDNYLKSCQRASMKELMALRAVV